MDKEYEYAATHEGAWAIPYVPLTDAEREAAATDKAGEG